MPRDVPLTGKDHAMGLNLVIACHAHKVKRWMYRGHEDGVVNFYREHWRCNLDRAGTVELSDDQADQEWINDDDAYPQENWPAWIDKDDDDG